MIFNYNQLFTIFTLSFLAACSINFTPAGGMALIEDSLVNGSNQPRLDLEFIRDPASGFESNPTTDLYLAILNDSDSDEVRYHLRHGADPNSRGTNNVYLLDVALYRGNPGIIAALKEYNARSTPGATQLHYAAWFNDLCLAKESLSRGLDVNACRECSISPLHETAYRGNYEMTKLFLACGARINAVNYWGRTPLHDALYQGQWTTAALLVQSNADLNSTDTSHNIPWQMILKSCGNIQCNAQDNSANSEAIAILLNAVVNHKTNPENNISALHSAAYYLNEQAVRVLIEQGASVHTKNFLGKTPLHDVVDPEELKKNMAEFPSEFLNRQMRIVTLILNAGGNPNNPDQQGETPFATAVIKNSLELVDLLLKNKADPNQPIQKFASLLHFCAATNKPAIALLALMHGANKDLTDTNHDTPLHLACSNRCDEVAKVLLDHYARIDIENKFKKTALQIDGKEKQVIRNYPKLQAFTMAMVNHPRLGAESTAQTASPDQKIFNEDVLKQIYSFLKKSY